MSAISGISGSSMPRISSDGSQSGPRSQSSFPQISDDRGGGDIVQISSAMVKSTGDTNAPVMKAAQSVQDSKINTAIKAYVQKHNIS